MESLSDGKISSYAYGGECHQNKVSYRGALVAVALIWCLLSWRWLSGGIYIPFDAMDEFYPQMLFNARSYIDGELPLWNPYLFAGFANVADPQGMVFSPLMNLIMVVLAPHYLLAFSIAVLLHVLLGGVGIVLCARDRGTPVAIAVIAALVYMFGGVAIARLQHTPMIVGYAILPFCFLYLSRVIRSGAWKAGLMAGIAGGLLLLHGTQVTYLATLFLVLYLLTNWRSLGNARRWTALVLAMLVALSLSFPFLYAVKVFLGISNRPEISYDYLAANPGGAEFLAFFTFLLSAYSGSTMGKPWLGELTSNYFYIGLVPLVLVGASILSKPKDEFQRREKAAFLLGLVFFITYALGPNWHVYRAYYELIPGVKLFRRPNDAMFLVNAIFAFLLLNLDDDSISRLRLYVARQPVRLAGLIIAGVAVVLWMAWFLYAGSVPFYNVAGRFLLPCLVYILLWVIFRKTRILTTILVLAVAADLAFAGVGKPFNAVGKGYVSNFFPKPGDNPVTEWLKPRVANQGGIDSRIEQIDAWRMWRNVPSIERFQSTLGYNPLVEAAYKRFYGAPESSASQRIEGVASSYGSPRFRALGVKYVVSSASLDQLDPEYLKALRGPVAEFDNTQIWEVKEPLPRVLNPKQFVVVAPGEGMKDFQPERSVEITDDGALTEAQIQAMKSCKGSLSYTLREYRNNRLEVEYVADAPAWFVLSDVYHPWWRASVNGERVPLFRANQAFRAVCVPAGKGVLSMDFHFMDL